MRVISELEAKKGKYSGKILAGRYHLLRRLGEGSEGVVYEAELRDDPTRRFAVKVAYAPVPECVCQDGLPGDPIFREFEILKRIDLPWFPATFGAGRTTTGNAFVVREYLEGIPVARLLNRPRTFPMNLAFRIGHELCRAVIDLHRAGWLHRDIKPPNVLAVHDGQELSITMLDFGSACPLGNEPPPSDLKNIPDGTPAYMAPERVDGAPGGASAELFSIAAILYEMLAGVPPMGSLGRDGTAAREYLQGDGPLPAVPLYRLRPDLPKQIANAIDRCLERDPVRRGDWIAGLQQILATHKQWTVEDIEWIEYGRNPQPSDDLDEGGRWLSRARLKMASMLGMRV